MRPIIRVATEDHKLKDLIIKKGNKYQFII